ncbi:ankyrin repeat-containing domain protein [Bisporella sp. PMI_857]|nr:ankyrin repeat-containing domain protein [Bisporella sp. PMI_857]
MSCAASGDIAGLRVLFNDCKASVTDRLDGGWTPLHVAAATGRLDTCKYLLAHGADVTSHGRIGLTPLHLAAAYGYLDVIKILVEHESDPETHNQHGFNAMFEVLRSPFISDRNLKTAIIKWILQQEHFVVSVNGLDYQGNSMLGWFAEHHPDGVKLLIDCNAEVNFRAYDGATPLH